MVCYITGLYRASGGVRKAGCCIMINAKSIFDCLTKRVSMQGLTEKKTALDSWHTREIVTR